MYKRHIIYLIFIGISSFLFFGFLIDINISESIMQNFITFLSITFGFYMTSLSVLYNSKFIKSLYEETDEEIPTQRKIHTLKAYFKYSAYWTLLTIIVLMFYSLIFSLNNNVYLISTLFEGMLISIVSMNFVFMILLLNVFLNGLIVESDK